MSLPNTTPIPRIPVKARELRRGDLLRVGPSTSYVLVYDAAPGPDGWIAVTLYNGTTPDPAPYRAFAPDADLVLSKRDATP